MTTLRIRQFEARYHLPPTAAEERRPLDTILAEVVNNALGQAFDRLGLPEDETVCIQLLHLPLRLRLSRAGAAEAWSAALARMIGGAVRGAHVTGIAHYPSRTHALLEFAVGVASGDMARCWAWKQLGLCHSLDRASEAEAIDELTEALLAEPAVIVPALVHLARQRLLGRLLRRIDVAGWRKLAETVLRQAGARAVAEPIQPLTPSSARVALARRVLQASRVGAALKESLRETSTRASALAPLVILEVDPGLASTGGVAVRELLAAITNEICGVANKNVWDGREERSEKRAWGAGSDGRRSATTEDVRRSEVENTRAPAARRPGLTQPASPASRPPVEARTHAWTRFGGLLFLVGVVDDLQLPRAIATMAAGTDRMVRWYLYQLAQRLAGAEATDAAVLAFAGLPPDVTPPSADSAPPSPEEDAFLFGLAEGIVGRVRELLGRSAQPASDLLEFICRRRAEIVADPGWFDVRLDLDEVSTEVRRAGLDLDPGYVPWLGVVLKFHYK